MVRVEGAGIAGRVLCRELAEAGIASAWTDRSGFPRAKVCGGVLQSDSWEYLKKRFSLNVPVRTLDTMSHFWRGKKTSSMRLSPPAVYVSRFELDGELETAVNSPKSAPELCVNAKGAAGEGEWIGFQSEEEASLAELRMHYGRGICLGLCPTPENRSHAAFIVKRAHFRDAAGLKAYVQKELGVKLSGELKGTGRIRYGYTSNALAIGDAKMTTFPFLGFGMKHAIDSARLLAACIISGCPADYQAIHRRRFRRQRIANALTLWFYNSPFAGILKPFVSNDFLFSRVYRFLHTSAVC